MSSRVILYPTTVRRVARAKAFEVTKPLVRDVLVGARALAPKGSRRHGSGAADTRPSIASSFGVRGSETSKYVTFEVFNRADHAATVAVGSDPHVINPKTGKLLAFEWPRANFQRRRAGMSPRSMFFFRKVRHPGNKRPVRFLQTPLVMFGRKHNFKTTVVANRRSRLP